jgi:hypothetical protein
VVGHDPSRPELTLRFPIQVLRPYQTQGVQARPAFLVDLIALGLALPWILPLISFLALTITNSRGPSRVPSVSRDPTLREELLLEDID